MGDENLALYEFSKTAFEKIVTFEIDTINNPITQAVMAIVGEYMTALPEWVIEEMLKQGALKFPDTIDTVWLLKAAALGVIDNIDHEDLNQAMKLLNEPAQRLVGKQIGKSWHPLLLLLLREKSPKK